MPTQKSNHILNIFYIYSALRQRSKSAHNGSRVRYKLPLISSDAESSLDSKVMTKSLKEILSNHFTSKKLKGAPNAQS